MNWPFWCVLGWVGFGAMTVAFWFLNVLLSRSHAREKDWAKLLKAWETDSGIWKQECFRMVLHAAALRKIRNDKRNGRN